AAGPSEGRPRRGRAAEEDGSGARHGPVLLLAGDAASGALGQVEAEVPGEGEPELAGAGEAAGPAALALRPGSRPRGDDEPGEPAAGGGEGSPGPVQPLDEEPRHHPETEDVSRP